MSERLQQTWVRFADRWSQASWPQRGLGLGLVLTYGAGLALFAQRAYWFAVHAWVRAQSEGPIQWLEPLHMRNALQVFEGKPLYGAPDTHFVGGMYTPAADMLHGWALQIFGVGYPALRAVALVQLSLMLALAGYWVYREAKSWPWALMVVGALLAIPVQMVWFTTVNVDAGYLLAAMTAFYLLTYHGHQRKPVVAAATLLALSFLLKPQGFVLAAAATLYMFLQHRSQAWVFAAVCAGLAGGAVLYLSWSSDGWFWTLVVNVPFGIETKTKPRTGYVLWLMSAPGSVSAVISGVALLFALTRPHLRSRATALLVFLSATALISWLSYRKVGGGENSLYPTLFAGLWLCAILPDLLFKRGALAHLAVRLGQAVVVTILLWGSLKESESVTRRVTAAPSFQAGVEKIFAERQSFEERLTQVARDLGSNVFVGARPLIQHRLGIDLNAHQTPIYNLTVRTNERTLEQIFDGSRYDAMLLWRYADKSLQTYVSKDFEPAMIVGRDPLLGLTVVVWRRVGEPDEGPAEPVNDSETPVGWL